MKDFQLLTFTGASFNAFGPRRAAAPMGTKKSSPKATENQQAEIAAGLAAEAPATRIRGIPRKGPKFHGLISVGSNFRRLWSAGPVRCERD